MAARRVSFAGVALTILTALAAPRAGAADAPTLVEAWRSAERFDADIGVSRAEHRAGQSRRVQSTRVWQPSVTFSATGGVGRADTAVDGARFSAPGFGTSEGVAFDTSVTTGASGQFVLAARQPIFNRELDAQTRQLALSADAAELQWEAARQELMLRTAERWLEVSLAAESLRVARRHQEAVARALGEATERYRIGDAPVTGTHEARARMEAVGAQILAAETDLDTREVALADVTGLPRETLRIGPPVRTQAEAPLEPLSRWLDEAASRNPGIRLGVVDAGVARERAAALAHASSPSIDLVARAGREGISGRGAYGSASNAAGNALIGVQITVPLYTGGMRDARHEEALHQVERADASLERTRRLVARQTRAAWLGLSAGAGRVAALTQGVVASEARLASTRMGAEVGDRSTIELLDAENDAADAALSLARARVGLLADRLRLGALAARLEEVDLHRVDQALAPPR